MIETEQASDFKDALKAYRRGRWSQAIRILRAAMERHPEHAAGWQLFGLVALRAGQPQFAENCFERAHRLRPQEWTYLLNLGVARTASGKPNQAIVAYREAIGLNPAHAEIYANLGNALRLLGRVDEAEHEYRRALGLDPENTAVREQLAQMYLDQDRHAQAMVLLDEALKINPADYDLHLTRIRALRSRCQIADALAAADQAMQAIRDSGGVQHAGLLLEAGRLYALGGNHSRAWPLIRKSLIAALKDKKRDETSVPLWNGEAMDGVLLIDATEQPELSLLFLSSLRQLRELGVAHTLLVPETFGRWLSLVDRDVPWTETARSDELWGAQISIEALPAVLGVMPQPLESGDGFERLGSVHSIGLAWHADEARASVPLRDLAPFIQLPETHFVALQPLGAEPESALPIEDQSMKWFGSPQHVLGQVDLVIGSDNAITRFAAASGKPTIMFLHASPAWPWGMERPDTGWMPSLRLVRQRQCGDWRAPVADTLDMLRQLGKL